MAAGEQDAVNPPAANPSIHQVGFRGLDAPAAAAPAPATDAVLDEAVQVARTQPAVQL